MGKRIVLTAVGSHGDLNPFLALGRALKSRGHSIMLAAPAPYVEDARREGFDFQPLRPVVDAHDPDFLRHILDPRHGTERIIREVILASLEDTYADLERASDGADLLLTHFLVFAAPVLAERRGLPWLSVTLQPMAFLSAHDPPVLAPFPALRHLRWLGPRWNGALLALLRRQSASWGEPVRRLRARLGLPRGPDPILVGPHSPHGVLAMFPEWFGPPQPDWPRAVRQCGFPFLDQDLSGAEHLDPRLEEFLAGGEPPVVFTMGSIAVRVAAELYRLAAGLGYRAVLLVGEARLDGLPPHVLALASAPYHRLFPRARSIVHSGGIGTTAQALRSGRPQVVLPFAHDQFDNACRVQRLRCGRWLAFRSVTPGKLRLRLERPGADRAERVAASVHDGIPRACAAIEAFWEDFQPSTA